MQQQVEEFHKKYGFPLKRSFLQECRQGQHFHFSPVTSMMYKILEIYTERGSVQADRLKDWRLYRVMLMLEELFELTLACDTRDEAEFVDGLTDLLYTVLGTFAHYGYPAQLFFDEVHRSNMTKDIDTYRNTDKAKREKGENFSPPRIQEMLDLWAKNKQSSRRSKKSQTS